MKKVEIIWILRAIFVTIFLNVLIILRIELLPFASSSVELEKAPGNSRLKTNHSVKFISQRPRLIHKPRVPRLVERKRNPERRNQSLYSKDYKLVLLYTPIWKAMPWPGVSDSYDFVHCHGKLCPISNCRITYNKGALSVSDVVIFHGKDLPSPAHMMEISPQKHRRQRWVFKMHENPHNTEYDQSLYDGFFNWTMTYRRDSDIFMPYDFYSTLPEPTEFGDFEENRNYAEGKEKLVAWMVSHCNTTRDEFVKKLQKYIDVDIYGKCSKHFGQERTCEPRSKECSHLLKQHKFYLSFENGFCEDYITEKYWSTPFEHGMIPVVLGGANYDHMVAVPGSYINVLDFTSIKKLADYLIFLDKNDSEYNKYFHWKKKYRKGNPECWTCNVCAAANNPSLPTKVYDLSSFWGVNTTCNKYSDKITQLLKD